MKIRTTLLLSLVFVVCACEKGDKPYVPVQRCPDLTMNIDSINLLIRGDWEWLEEFRISRDGVHYFTPDSPGFYHIRLILSGDTARFFRNNIVDSVYQFRIQRQFEITNYPLDSLPVIAFYSFYSGNRMSYVPIMICKNQLLMMHQYVSSIVGENLWKRN